MSRRFLAYLGACAIIAIALLILAHGNEMPFPTPELAESAQVAAVVPTIENPSTTSVSILSPPAHVKLESEKPPNENTSGGENAAPVRRVQDPYESPPLSTLEVNFATQAALVNILCSTQDANLQNSSGSGVIIDPRGVILTNAHVAQYVLLAQSGRTNLSCVVRSGAPARARWGAEVLYIPPIWIQEHAEDITDTNPTGTGEHDYALLRIVPLPQNQNPFPELFPYLPVDSREGIGFSGDPALAASYPSEFVGSQATQFNLYPASSITSIKKLYTFDEKTIDLLSIGGVPEAQSGSSGGAVVNMWGHLIGIITTTSEGATTADRELRALSLSYINRDILAQSGEDLATMLARDSSALARAFVDQRTTLVDLLIEAISRKIGR